MFIYFKQQKQNNILFLTSVRCLVFILSFFLVFGPSAASAQSIKMLNLPAVGTMVTLSPAFVPVLLRGMTIHPEDPLKFDFIVDSGNTDFDTDQIKEESERLVKYFLASMTVPKDDLWVNLSPYEGERIIPDELGKTELGRDLLAQDYILKQLTASLMYPEKELGKEFWDRIYARALKEYGTTEIPVDTFNKVWILPQEASVYEHGQTVYVVEAKLKVMLDSDYEAYRDSLIVDRESPNNEQQTTNNLEISKQIIKDIILPEIEKEVNEGKNFAPLRQIYYSLILAKWYKETIKDSLLSEVYVDQNKVSGVETDDATLKDQIYSQYMEAYKKGVFNYIKEDYDRLNEEVIPRKYFSGGFRDDGLAINHVSSPIKGRGLEGEGFTLAMSLSLKGGSSSSPIFENFKRRRIVKKEIKERLDPEDHGLIEKKHINRAIQILDEGFTFEVGVKRNVEKGGYYKEELVDLDPSEWTTDGGGFVFTKGHEQVWYQEYGDFLEIIKGKKLDQSSSPITREDAFNYQQDVREAFQQKSEQARQMFSSETDSQEYKDLIRKNRDAKGTALFINAPLGQDARLRQEYKNVQDIVAEHLREMPLEGRNYAILDEIHLTVANMEITDGSHRLTRTLEDVLSEAKEDAEKYGVKSFELKLIGPRLMRDSAVVMEYEILDPDFLQMRKAAEERIKQADIGANTAFAPDIYHSTVALITNPDASKETLRKLSDTMDKVRDEISKRDLRATINTMQVTQYDVAQRKFLKSEQYSLSSSPIFGEIFGSKRFKEELEISDRAWRKSVLLIKALEQLSVSNNDVNLLKDKGLVWLESKSSFQKDVALNVLRFLYKKNLINLTDSLIKKIFQAFKFDQSYSVKLAALDFLGAIKTRTGSDNGVTGDDVTNILEYRDEALKRNDRLRKYESFGVYSDINKLTSGVQDENSFRKLLDETILEVDQSSPSISIWTRFKIDSMIALVTNKKYPLDVRQDAYYHLIQFGEQALPQLDKLNKKLLDQYDEISKKLMNQRMNNAFIASQYGLNNDTDYELWKDIKQKQAFVRDIIKTIKENINGESGSSDDSSKTSSPISSEEDVGGIDMNNITVDKQGSGIDIQFDPIDVQEIKGMNIEGFTPVIINITPLPSILPLLGLQPQREEELELSRI